MLESSETKRKDQYESKREFDFDFDSFTSNPTCGVSAPALRVVCPNEVLRPAGAYERDERKDVLWREMTPIWVARAVARPRVARLPQQKNKLPIDLRRKQQSR